jgi:hypothetical protein
MVGTGGTHGGKVGGGQRHHTTEVGDGRTLGLLLDLPCSSRGGALQPGDVGLLHAAGEVDAACSDAATPWALDIAVGSASSKGLTGDVALHAAGLADVPCVHVGTRGGGARVARKRWRRGSRGGGWERGARQPARGRRR